MLGGGFIRTIAIALGALACSSAPPPMPPSSPSHLLKQTMPSIRRPAIDGRPFDSGTYRDRVLVVKFFAKYCAPCQKTLPATEALHRKRPDVVVVGISEDETTADAREQVRQHGLSFPVIQDAGNVLAGRFRVSEMPVTFVGDYGGHGDGVGGPDQTDEALAQAIEALRR